MHKCVEETLAFFWFQLYFQSQPSSYISVEHTKTQVSLFGPDVRAAVFAGYIILCSHLQPVDLLSLQSTGLFPVAAMVKKGSDQWEALSAGTTFSSMHMLGHNNASCRGERMRCFPLNST